MTHFVKYVSLAIGLTAFVVLAIFGFAVWIFIPILPAGILFIIILTTARRRAIKTEKPQETNVETTGNLRKAA
jgi:fatty acid desaturase